MIPAFTWDMPPKSNPTFPIRKYGCNFTGLKFQVQNTNCVDNYVMCSKKTVFFKFPILIWNFCLRIMNGLFYGFQ